MSGADPGGGPAVVDASVALKWVLPEAGAGEAVSLRERLIGGGAAVYVPDLFWAETANVLWRLGRGAGAVLDAEEVVGSFGALKAAPLTTVPVRSVAERALQIAIVADITAYDAAYVAVAELRDARLWTADRRLVTGLAGSKWAGVAVLVESG